MDQKPPDPDPTAAAPLDLTGPFTRAQALAAGIGRRQLTGPAYRRLLPGVYAPVDLPLTPALRAAAALKAVGPGPAFASHFTAARVLGLAVPTHSDEHVTVGNPAQRRGRTGLQCHVRPGAPIQVVDGISVPAAEDLFVELAGYLDLVDLVVVGDQLVRRSRTTPGKLVRAAARARGRIGRAARRAAALVRARVDSPMETRLRLLLVLAGIPEPVVNPRADSVGGRGGRRFDLCWPTVRVIVEYDGRHHIERVDQWESDLERREEIDGDQWRIVVVVARGIYTEPERTLDRVFGVLRAQGLPGLPVRPRDDWRPHFPGHDRQS